MTHPPRLHGKLAVVSGASSGIGKALVEVLAARGVRIIAIGRDTTRLRALVGPCGVVEAYEADLTDDGHIEALRNRLEGDAPIDVLVHSAAVIKIGSMATASVQDLDWHYRTNVRAPYLLTQVLLPLLSPEAQIVFLNSSAGLVARATLGQYAASKHALKALADSLREELHDSGKRVLSVFPGRTATPMQESLLRMEGRPYDVRRLIAPEELAAMIADSLETESVEIKEIHVRPRFE